MKTLVMAFLILLLQAAFVLSLQGVESNVHIVYMGAKKHHDPNVITDSHHQMLASLLGSKEAAQDSLVYSYKHGFSGFAAKLTESQAQQLKEHSEVIKVIRSRRYQLHTTRSWDFLGVYPPKTGNLLSKGKQGDGIIIGVVDSGVWPESESFSDAGMGPIPSRWKGICEQGDGFNASNCNKKIIGARWFLGSLKGQKDPKKYLSQIGEVASARDMNGHGSHTASTAAGSLVPNTSFLGVAYGVAKGGAPKAHLAIYKLLDAGSTEDVVAAIDQAIHDGVDILSLSIGLSSYLNTGEGEDFSFFAFHAVAHGITVTFAAGNDGPRGQTVDNLEPWVLSVAASTIDRSFPVAITLGNNVTFLGQALYKMTNKKPFLGLVYSGNIGMPGTEPRTCSAGSLNATLVKGNIVLCINDYNPESVQEVTDAGGAGIIFAQRPMNNLISCGSFACIFVGYEVGNQIKDYINNARSPKLQLSSSTTINGNLVPSVSYFSSRGPNPLYPAILKPDIAAPGANILAAWSPKSSELYPSESYVIMSGTSMACPHVAGIAALLKSAHPGWSPTAIKSALVTTASTTDVYGQPIGAESYVRKIADPFDYGGGLVNPNAASNPGLIYDMTTKEYALFLCVQGLNNLDIRRITNDSISCPRKSKTSIMLDLNLPSITIPNLKSTITLSRTVTNVGAANVVYVAHVEAPAGVKVDVSPKTLSFNGTTKVLSFQVKITPTPNKQGFYTFGSLTWKDGTHKVRIPIVVQTILYDNYEDAS